jgi:hypothetical protein
MCTIEQIDVRSHLFNNVLELRRDSYKNEQAGAHDAIDDYSLHFVARSEAEVIGALRVTCRKDGPLESEKFYPQWLLDEFGQRMCAASRMCVRSGLQGCSPIPHDLTMFAWSIVLPLGIRIDVSKARLKAVPFYMRMGYLFVRESIFDFGRWSARCGLIAFPATPNHSSKLSHLFSNIDNPCDLSMPATADRFVTTRSDFYRLVDTNECKAASGSD